MEIWRKNKYIFIAYGLMLLICLVVFIQYEKEAVHLYINRHNSPFADYFYKYITQAGNGIFVVAVSLLLVLWKTRYAVLSLSVYLFSGLVVQICKRLVWPDTMRPVMQIGKDMLHLVDGVAVHTHHSFPSGHSASAFGLCFVLIFLVKNDYLKVLFFILACFTAYSRVYLSQHFLVDVVVGSIIGMGSALLGYKIIMKNKAKWLDFKLTGRKNEEKS